MRATTLAEADEGGAAASRRCGSALLLSLPDDVLALISAHLHPRDLSNLSLSCRVLRAALSSSDKVWLAQCLRFSSSLSPHLLPLWRSRLPSYRALCRFLSSASPLLGLWVHQNPELGNVVFVLWGFLSLVACRVIPQELHPLGLDSGPLLWAPVFEILCDPHGSPSLFFLHGHESSLYPGSLGSIDRSSNVLLLEVAVHPHPHHDPDPDPDPDPDLSFRKLPAPPPPLPFGKLAFGDRRRLLDFVAGNVRHRVPPDLAAAPLFPLSCGGDDERQLADRRSALIELHNVSGGRIDWRAAELNSGSIERKASNGEGISFSRSSSTGKRRGLFSVAGYVKDGLRQFMGRSSSLNRSSLISRNGTSLAAGESKHVPLHEFLRWGDALGLSLRAANMKLTTYRAWPNMHDNRFALYKLPLQDPMPGQDREYAGLWGGAFGWPPGRPSEDKPGKALFFLLLSYEEVEGHLLLIATKILEGTHYVLHPNGSAMFTVKVDEPASELFPWEMDGDSQRVEVKHSYAGEGIANGYGFRYPGSKPGSLFEIQNGRLAFVWRESKAVLTLQRLELQELLKKGERVPALPPIANFAYLTKSYSNVYAGLPGNSSCSPSPR